MTLAASLCVCRASIVMTAPARSVNAFSSSRTAGISLDFASTATWPRNRTGAVRQGRDQVRGLPVPVFRAADGLAVNRDHQPSAGPRRPGVQPGAEDMVEPVGADQGERAPEGDSSARPRAAPSPVSTSALASAIHYPIAANDLDLAVTAAMPTASRPAS